VGSRRCGRHRGRGRNWRENGGCGGGVALHRVREAQCVGLMAKEMAAGESCRLGLR
jgi:hypothetical protein